MDLLAEEPELVWVLPDEVVVEVGVCFCLWVEADCVRAVGVAAEVDAEGAELDDDLAAGVEPSLSFRSSRRSQ